MAQGNLVAYALTTRQKVKDHLNIQDINSDAIIDTLINQVTAFIESYCGNRRFASTAYVEIKDTYNSDKIFFNQKPVITLTAAEYRGGTLSSPTWYTYAADSYYQYLKQGFIQFTAKLRAMPQAFRLSYTAGYLIDWDHETDATKHTLPFDLTQVATETVAKVLNTRFSQGIYSESTEGQSITYSSNRNDVQDDHKIILDSYKINRAAP